MEQDTQGKPGISISKLVFGLGLIVIGVAAFLGAIDVWSVRRMWRLWPVFLILLGLSGELEAIQKRRSDGGFVLIAVGCWLLAGTFHLFGFTVGQALPIGVVVAGFFVVLHALIDRPTVKGKENDNVC